MTHTPGLCRNCGRPASARGDWYCTPCRLTPRRSTTPATKEPASTSLPTLIALANKRGLRVWRVNELGNLTPIN